MKTKIVFLDRDGVINEFPGNGNYVTRVKNFHFVPGALDALKALKEAGCTVFVISNQAGVGRGVYSQDKLNRITNKMETEVKKAGGRIKKVFYCTHKPDAGCSCRKPSVGSIGRALKMMNKSFKSTRSAFFVGDTKVDIEAGYNAGCRTIFVLSGRENRRYMRGWIVKPDYIAKDLFEATKIITGNANLRRSYARKNGVKKPKKG